jgi:UPF0755 protein
LLVAAALLIGAAAVALVLGQRWLNQPLAIPAAGYSLDLAAGTSLRALAAKLEREGILDRPSLLVAYGRLTGQAGELKAGEYAIAPGTSPRELLRQLVEGRVRLHSITIVEGWTTRELLRTIRKHPAIRTTLPQADEQALAEALDLPSPHPEGWFFPDTYRFPRGTTDRELLGIAYRRMRTVLDRAWAAREQDLPLRSPYEALILASIVERETALERERPLIAGVFIRRLRAGMKLQTDPTVIYGLGEDFDGNITRRDLLRDTPYNTYTRAGLPPTPIALPGESSLLAAVRPDDSPMLYFVASGAEDGSHVFSATLSEHNAAVKRYLNSLRASDR